MRIFSRYMPRAPESKTTVLGAVVLVLILLGVALCCYVHPVALLVLGSIAIITWVAGIIDDRRFRRLAQERDGESICDFARSFDHRVADPWVIRAVHESLQPYLLGRETTFPIRASDRLAEDISIDPEDLDDLAREIATRSGHDLTNAEENPLYDKVETVGDLVMFLSHQPRTPDAEQDESTVPVKAAPSASSTVR